MPDIYAPPQGEVDDFNALLADVPPGELTQELVLDPAGRFWGRELRAGRSLRLPTEDGTGHVDLRPPKPAAAPAQTPAEPAPTKPPEPFSDLPDHVAEPFRHRLSMLEDPRHNPWGADLTAGSRYITDDRTPPSTASEADQAAVDALRSEQDPAVGKQKAVNALRDLAAAHPRAPLSPAKQARLEQARAEVQAEGRAAFQAEMAEREARGEPVYTFREAAAIADRHGYTLPPAGRSWR